MVIVLKVTRIPILLVIPTILLSSDSLRGLRILAQKKFSYINPKRL